MFNCLSKNIAALVAGIFILIDTGTSAANTVEEVSRQQDILETLKAVLVGGAIYALIPLLLAFIIIRISMIIVPKMHAVRKGRETRGGTGNEALDNALEAAGYSYDVNQDVFYSHMNPWQRKYGYCRLYDEAIAPLGMVVDCEPIYFEFEGKKWLIEFWKGQYGLTTGCEIGLYIEALDLEIPGIFNGTFYNSVSDEHLLQMSCSLEKNGVELFRREDNHWWLTGFKLGEFSEPSELTMYIKIKISDPDMRDAFFWGLNKAGYTIEKITLYEDEINLKFDKPVNEQPITRTKLTDWVIQRKNEYLCGKYREITGGSTNIADKIKAIEQQAPDMYEKIINIGKVKQVYEMYETIKNYLKQE